MAHKVSIIENTGLFLARCSCDWVGKLKPFKKTAWLDGYIHRREKKVVGRNDPKRKWEDELMSYLMADELEMKVKTREWRIALNGYIKAMRREWTNKGVRIGIKYWGKTELPHRVKVYFDCFNLQKVVNYTDWDFVLFLSTVGIHERFSAHDELKDLSKQEALVKATTYMLHLDSRYEQKKKEWPIWLKRLRQFYTGKMKTIDGFLIESHSKRKSTWQWLKERYPTVEDVRNALQSKDYSDSYRELLEKLEKWHAKNGLK